MRTRAMFRELRGLTDEARRATEIAALPKVTWRGMELHTILCNGDFGKGPHVMHLPESTLWALIDLGHFRCVYHAG